MSGVANMSQGLNTLERVRARIKGLPLELRAQVANAAATKLTALLREDFAAGKTVYDTARPKGVAGQTLTLKKSGKTESGLRFVAIGTIVRAQLAQNYQRYLVGKYQILPRRLPASFAAALGQIIRDAAAKFEREALR